MGLLTKLIVNIFLAAAMGIRIRGHAKLMSSIATATVPKVTIVCGNSIGVGNYLMVRNISNA